MDAKSPLDPGFPSTLSLLEINFNKNYGLDQGIIYGTIVVGNLRYLLKLT